MGCVYVKVLLLWMFACVPIHVWVCVCERVRVCCGCLHVYGDMCGCVYVKECLLWMFACVPIHVWVCVCEKSVLVVDVCMCTYTCVGVCM